MMKIWSALLLFYNFIAVVSSIDNICIIGSGISASSTAYFIREYGQNNVAIKVFEKHNSIGGRVDSFKYNQVPIEAGGSVIHCENRYMMKFAEMLGLNVKQASEGDKLMGIFNGDHFVYKSTGWKWIDTFQMVWRYQHHLLKMDSFVTKLIANFNQIYSLQDEEKCYANPVDLLKALDVYQLTQTSLHEALENEGISSILINELATAINRVNYGQNATLNAFAGAVGLAGSGSKLRVIEKGNKQVIEGLLNKANAEVLTESVVKAITRAANKYELKVNDRTESCDAVVIATPLESAAIKLPSDLSGKLHGSRKLQLTETTFVEGDLNLAFFGLHSHVPDIILTTENQNLPFSSIGLVHRPKSSKSVYKVFSRNPLTDYQLERIFSSFKVLRIYPWLAYPYFDPPEIFSDFVLDDGLIYVNAIENAASALEVMSLSGRNAALLLKKYFNWSGKSTRFAERLTDEL